MAWPKFNYVMDMLMAAAFVVTSISALLFFFNLFSTSREFLWIQRADWSFLHRWLGIAFIVLVVLHFILHWDWITAMTKEVFKKQA